MIFATLKPHIKTFTRIACDLYKQHVTLPLNNVSSIVAMDKCDQQLAQEESFKKCIELMDKDADIAKVTNTLVGTHTCAVRVESVESILIAFAKRVFLSAGEFSEGIFEKIYTAFEEFLYRDTLKFKYTCLLYEFDSEDAEIRLSPDLIIRRVNDDETKRITELLQQGSPRGMFPPSFVLEYQREEEKIIGERNRTPKMTEDIKSIFDSVIYSLRILKHSTAFRDSHIRHEMLTFHPHWGHMETWSLSPVFLIGSKCVLNKAEAKDLIAIWAKVRGTDNPSFKIAMQRLSYGMEREALENKLIDFFIGLEALYLPKAETELSFRLALRTALLLSPNKDIAKNEFNFMREMYGKRSAVMHGGTSNLESGKVLKLEEILRQSLKMYIQNPDRFRENYLNSILFNQN